MAKYAKGLESRASILTRSRQLLNEKGLGQTMDGIANALGLSRGRITHFFPTSASLMMGIMRDYEHELSTMIHDFDYRTGPDFDSSFLLLDKIVDLQYAYRCALLYLSTVNKGQGELHQHIEGAFFNRIDAIRMRTIVKVSEKLLHPKILDKENWEVYCFQYTSLLTTWVISQELYYSRHPITKMKPVYVVAAMNLYLPYLTIAGEKAFKKALIAYKKKSSYGKRVNPKS